MRKIILLCLIIVSLGLSGCDILGKGNQEIYYIETSKPSGELLMDLPENVQLLSKSFRFIIPENEGLGEMGQRLIVTARYEMQNDGLDTTMNISLPIDSVKLLDADDILYSNIQITVNDEIQGLNWRFMNDSERYLMNQNYSYENLQLGLEQEEDFLVNEQIHQYEFTLPQQGKEEELSIYIPEGTKILQDYYSVQQTEISSALTTLFEYTGGDMVLTPTRKVTTARFYTIGNEAVFTSNYDMRNSFTTKTIEQYANQTCYTEYCVKGQLAALSDFIRSENDVIDIYTIGDAGHPSTEKLFALEEEITLGGYGEKTIIEASYYIDGGLYLQKNEETNQEEWTLVYDFYLDSESIEHTDTNTMFFVAVPFDIATSNHTIGDSNTIDLNPEIGNHVQFEIIVENPDYS